MASITQLEYILAVEQNGHFGKAAKACHVTQPSLSVQIQKLEEDLGIIIFDRTKKPILVTELGKKIISQAKVVVREFHKMRSIADGTKNDVSGKFRLGIIPTLAPYVIPLFIENFSKLYPAVELSIEELQTHQIIDLLEQDKIDAGLLVTPLRNDSVIERVLFYEPFYAYASEGHPVLKKKSLEPNDITYDDAWLLDEGHCFRNQVLNFCKILGQSKVLDNVSFQSGNIETLIQLVNGGKGFTFIPHLAMKNLSSEDKKKHLRNFKKPEPTREVSLVHIRSFHQEKIIEAIEKSIIDCLPPEISSLKSSKVQVIDI